MNTYYATKDQQEKLPTGERITTNCDCGQSIAIQITKDTLVIICDACHFNCTNFERYY
jgi:hypothetical protein